MAARVSGPCPYIHHAALTGGLGPLVPFTTTCQDDNTTHVFLCAVNADNRLACSCIDPGSMPPCRPTPPSLCLSTCIPGQIVSRPSPIVSTWAQLQHPLQGVDPILVSGPLCGPTALISHIRPVETEATGQCSSSDLYHDSRGGSCSDPAVASNRRLLSGPISFGSAGLRSLCLAGSSTAW